MATVTIEGKEYDIDSLSQEAKTQLGNIQAVDRKLSDLQQEAAILQTARNAYAAALKAQLPDS